MFITFEGLDFCGKSTQVELLKEYLIKRNKAVKIIREPGGTKISEKIRDLLLDRDNNEMIPLTELLLFTASRVQLVKQIIIPSIEKGTFVISDRFHDSSIAYQGYGRGIDLDFVIPLQNFAIKGAEPDITFFLDIPVQEVNKRKRKLTQQQLDRIEISKNKFYEDVRMGYLKIAEKEKRFKIINGLNSIEEIHKQIINEINKLENIGS